MCIRYSSALGCTAFLLVSPHSPSAGEWNLQLSSSAPGRAAVQENTQTARLSQGKPGFLTHRPLPHAPFAASSSTIFASQSSPGLFARYYSSSAAQTALWNVDSADRPLSALPQARLGLTRDSVARHLKAGDSPARRPASSFHPLRQATAGCAITHT